MQAVAVLEQGLVIFPKLDLAAFAESLFDAGLGICCSDTEMQGVIEAIVVSRDFAVNSDTGKFDGW